MTNSIKILKRGEIKAKTIPCVIDAGYPQANLNSRTSAEDTVTAWVSEFRGRRQGFNARLAFDNLFRGADLGAEEK